MDYTVIETTQDECELARLVREYMKHGWVPCGGVAVTVIPAGGAGDIYTEEDPQVLYLQALTHEQDGAFLPGVGY